MQSVERVNHQTRSIPNDGNFAPHKKSSASVLSTRDAARFDSGLPAAAQIASAENTPSSRTIAGLENDYMLHKYESSDSLDHHMNDDSENAGNTPIFFYRATLFDSVMDFLDQYDHCIRQQSTRSEG